MANVKRIPNLLVGSEAISIEGGLLSPEWLSKIAQLQAMAQSGSDYGIPKGLTLRDEIGRYWRISEALWQEYQAKTAGLTDTRAQTEKFVNDLFKQCLGFDDLKATEPVTVSERIYPIRAAACNNKVPIVISSPQESLDKLSERFGEDHKRRTAFGLLQEYLNASENVLWGIVCDGESLRIVRDNSSLTKPAWISVELKRIFDEQIYADFAVFWLLCHRSRFETPEGSVSECILEKWKEAGRAVGTRARDQLRIGVEEAIELLGQGFLANTDNNELRLALQSGRLTTQHYFQELLRVVYRLIFLITIEERDLIHPEGTSEQVRNLYLNGYSVKRLREKSIRRATYDRFSDLWDSLKIVFKGLGLGESRLGLPALGGLFDASQTAALNTARIDNGFFLQAILKLYWLKSDSGVVRVNWRDMGPEELGSVYESLLELVPQVSEGGQRFSFLRGEDARGNSRKLTGSYYTPDDLVQTLLDSALEPVIANTIKNNPQDPVKALLNLTIIDPACGSAHFLLAAARRLAVHVARLEADGTPTSKEYRIALRRVIGNCIYGVDRNPMALELARMSLWLEAMTPEAPLNFLDHHMVCGDALIGLLDLEVLNDGIPSEAFSAQNGDDKEICKELAKENKKKLKDIARAREINSQSPQLFDLSGYNLVPILKGIEDMPDNTPQEVVMKQIALENYNSTATNAGVTVAAEMYVAAFFAPKTQLTKNLIPTTDDLLRAIRGVMPRIEVINFIKEIAREGKFLNWKLKFANVFEKGGFDVVLGNPPWDMVQLDPREYFARHSIDIATSDSVAVTERLVGELLSQNPSIANEYSKDLRKVEAAQLFFHAGRRFQLSNFGRLNSAPLFVESSLKIRSLNGRAGIVVPSGIATDSFSQHFFSYLTKGRLVSLIDFENREGIFPAVDSRYKFCLLTIGASERTTYSFFLTKVSHASDIERQFEMTTEELRRINPNTGNCPIFRTKRDAELAKKIYNRVPVLWNESSEGGNPWSISFQLMFMMNTDVGYFRTKNNRDSLSEPTPLYEAKMVHLYDDRFATYDEAVDVSGNIKLATRAVTENEKRTAGFSVSPRYWVEREEVERRLGEKGWRYNWLIGFRDVARATDERTMICSVIPRVAVGNGFPLVFVGEGFSPNLVLAFVANLSSLVFDFFTRQKVGGTHLNFYIVKQLPVIPPSAYSPNNLNFIVPRVIKLYRHASFGSALLRDCQLSEDVFENLSDDADQLKAELDAFFGYLYGLNRDELQYLLDPTEIMGAEYPTESFRVLKEYEIKTHGRFRTKDLILSAWDSLNANGLFI